MRTLQLGVSTGQLRSKLAQSKAEVRWADGPATPWRSAWGCDGALAFASTDFMLPNCWAVCLDIGRRYSGTVTGFMNTAGQFGWAIAATAFGYFAGRQQWNLAILITAGCFWPAPCCGW